MDARIYILPILSIILIAVIIMRPDITGYMVAAGSTENIISADISVNIKDGGLIPEDSVVTVSLGDLSASMPFSEFVEKSGRKGALKMGGIPEIGYDGMGYSGIRTYVVPISEFDLDTTLMPGEQFLIIEVSYDNFVISRDEQELEF